MGNKLQRGQVMITDCSEDNPEFMKLWFIFRQTLRPDFSFRQFRMYYYSPKLEYIDVTFLYDRELVTGFCAAAFYRFDRPGKAGTLGRSATGILEQYHGKGLPKWELYYKYIRYKKHNPFKELILTAYVANPIVYSMICKYTGIVYPRRTVGVSEKVMKLKQQVLLSSGLTKRESSPFAVAIHFDVQKGDKLLQRINNSTDEHVQFFIRQTRMQPQVTLLVIIPISWQNIMLTTVRFAWRPVLRIMTMLTLFIYANMRKSKLIDEESSGQKNKSANACNTLKNKYKKMYDMATSNCKKPFTLGVQYCNRVYKQTEDANWKRLRTLFTKP